MDDFDFEPTEPVRAAGRFRPKAKPKSTKLASTEAASAPCSSTLSTNVSDSIASTSVDVGEGKLSDPVGSSAAASEIFGSIESLENNEYLSFAISSSDGDRNTGPSELPPTKTLQPQVAASDGSEYPHSGFGNLAGENSDIFSGLECLDNFPTQTSSDAAQDQVSKEAGTSNENGEIQLETEVDGSFSGIEAFDIVAELPISADRHPGKFQPKPRVKKGKENPNIPHSEIESTELPQSANVSSFENADMDVRSVPDLPLGDIHDLSSSALHPTPDLQENAENLAEISQLDDDFHRDASQSEGACGTDRKIGNGKASRASNQPQKRKQSAGGEDGKDGISSRKSRKRLPCQQVDEPDVANEDNINAETFGDLNGNEDVPNNNEDGQRNKSQRKRAPRKFKKPVSENEKPVRKSKRAKKADDESTKEPTKKKFSHSTRRNRRQVDKSLLEIPEDEFDTQRVPIKDLIRLQEYRERLEIKEAAKLKSTEPNQSANDEFDKEASYNEEENFGFDQERNFDENQASYRVNTSSSFNYQSYMNKAPVTRWSKQDTELFYEAIEQFGADFSMIETLFPGRSRHQLKLKFKKEERQNPSRIDSACLCSSQEFSKYVSVINELQKAAPEKQEFNADESIDKTGQEELEPTIDNGEGVTEPDKIQDMETEAATEVQHEEAAVDEIHSPIKSNESDDDNGFEGWGDEF